MPPTLSEAEIKRFVELGTFGWAMHREGKLDVAREAFESQIAIYGNNPEPFAALALIAASEGDKKVALEQLRCAIVRGYSDMYRFENAEVWKPLKRHRRFLALVDSVPSLTAIEDGWPSWDAFYSTSPPESLARAMQNHSEAIEKLERLIPAIGARDAKLWRRLLDRVTATALEAYVVKRQDAADFGESLATLMKLYAGGDVVRWTQLPEGPTSRLTEVSAVALEKLDDPTARRSALFAAALAANSDRKRDGSLRHSAADQIRQQLGQLIETGEPDRLTAWAAIGLIRTEWSGGDRLAARDVYRRIQDGPTLDTIRGELGSIALSLGGLPEFESKTLSGESFTRASLANRVTVIDFWATWCGPCVEELPTLKKIASDYGDQVDVVGINMDSIEMIDEASLRQWIDDQGVPGEQLFDGAGWSSDLVRAFGVREIPFNVVVDANGKIVAINEHGKRLERAISAAVNSN